MAKFFIDQHGCAKNQTDGELITGFLTQSGFEYTDQAQNADFIIINSCGFIESAKKESINAVYSIKQMYPKAKIILAGCLAQRYEEDLKKEDLGERCQVVSENNRNFNAILLFGRNGKAASYSRKTGPRAV